MSRTLRRALLLVGAAASLNAFAVTAAPAGRLRIPAQNLTIEGQITVRGPEGRSITCNARRTGTVGGTIDKVVGTVIGRIAEVRLERCVGGMLIPIRLPWDKRYQGFDGVLPRIAGVRTRIDRRWTAVFREFFEIRCNYEITPMIGTFVLPEGETFRLDESVSTRSETPFCPEIEESGGPAVTPPITVDLI